MEQQRLVISSCVAALAVLAAAPKLRLALGAMARRLLRLSDAHALRQLAARKKQGSGPWFAGTDEQKLTSAATNTVDTDPTAYTGPTVYQGEHSMALPYPPISDDTEAISGFADLVSLRLAKPGQLVLNLGGGAFDGGPTWLQEQIGGVRVATADPFRRSAQHNGAVQELVEREGGADVVASISVLNVIAEVDNRLAHIALAYRVLRPGGVCYFKVWGGCWPERGLGEGEADEARGTYQTLRWADAYLMEVQAVFGESQCFADSVRSMLIAIKGA